MQNSDHMQYLSPQAWGYFQCRACGNAPKYTILLCVQQSDHESSELAPRNYYHIPNQYARACYGHPDLDATEQVAFCHDCMKEIESTLTKFINRTQDYFALDAEGVPLVK